MNPDTTNIYFGPPGTGKTTKLLSIVEMLLDDGFPSQGIMLITFTRRAAREARDRAVDKFKIHPDNLPWFRTIHSLAFHQLALSNREVMGVSDYLELAKMLGVRITLRNIAEDGTLSGLTKGDRLFFMENMSRANKCGLQEYWERFPNEDIYLYELQRLQDTLISYKRDTGKIDFTDMIIKYRDQGSVPDHRVLILDEAQDLTPLQWDVVNKLSANVEETHVAGDDDQAIFRWAGADVEHLINLPGHRVVLDQSYRCPRLVHEVAERIASQITNRVPKLWNPRKAEGTVNYETTIDHIDMSTGTWLCLARNQFLLEQFNNHCLREGFVFESQFSSPTKSSTFRAIRDWEKLRSGESVTAAQAKVIYDLMSTRVGVRHGSKGDMDACRDEVKVTIVDLAKSYGLLTSNPWHEALDKIPVAEKQYYIAALARGEKFLESPRIRISTIHGAKGAEADNVILATDMAERTFMEALKNPEDEDRVWYVGVTRAKERLVILSNTTRNGYKI